MLDFLPPRWRIAIAILPGLFEYHDDYFSAVDTALAIADVILGRVAAEHIGDDD